jgi:hypothetical protein
VVYYIVTVRFECASCKQTSAEEMIAEAEKFDPNIAAKDLAKQPLRCHLCGKPPADGTPVDVHAERATEDQLKKLGFSVPRANQ